MDPSKQPKTKGILAFLQIGLVKSIETKFPDKHVYTYNST